jgi:hypothetical protein
MVSFFFIHFLFLETYYSFLCFAGPNLLGNDRWTDGQAQTTQSVLFGPVTTSNNGQ